MTKQTFTTGQVLTAAQMTSLQQTAMGGGSTTAKTASYTLVAADAGTVVQMNSASATTITVNQSLFAAGDTVQIQNVGSGVCTVTAGTATVSTAGSLALSQYEGGQLYFNTTSAALFFDLVQSAAAGGKVLQVVTANITTDTTISSTTYTDTAMTITISPTLATSTILVLFALQCRISTTANDTVGIGLKLLRGATTIVDMSAGTNSRAFAIQATADGVPTLASTIYTNYNYVDSPATTSATTYKVQAAINSTAASRSARFQMQNIPSVITVLEIGA